VTYRSGTADEADVSALGHIIPMYVYPANLPNGSRGADIWETCPPCRPEGVVTDLIANVANGVADPTALHTSAVSPGPGAWSIHEASASTGTPVDLVDPNYRRAELGAHERRSVFTFFSYGACCGVAVSAVTLTARLRHRPHHRPRGDTCPGLGTDRRALHAATLAGTTVAMLSMFVGTLGVVRVPFHYQE
jgi:hypothetical protein